MATAMTLDPTISPVTDWVDYLIVQDEGGRVLRREALPYVCNAREALVKVQNDLWAKYGSRYSVTLSTKSGTATAIIVRAVRAVKGERL